VRALAVVVVSPMGELKPNVEERREVVFVKHSSRNRLLKLSMKAFCTGFPG
jgi:hypothetical protein